jgi:ABC-type antimicrobial peptide transport system permease subunit
MLAYSIAQRTQEIGIRVAMGANRADILMLVLREGMFPAIFGAIVGLLLAFAGTRVLAAVLYEVSPKDPAVFVTAPFILLAVALAACLIPAFKATVVDPVVALKQD